MGFIVVIGLIILGMFLFSLFNKDEREKINKGVEAKEKERIQKKVENMFNDTFQEAVSEDGMDGLVGIMQMNFTMNKVNAKVSHNGSELIVNLLDKSLISIDSEYDIEQMKEASKQTIRNQTPNARLLNEP